MNITFIFFIKIRLKPTYTKLGKTLDFVFKLRYNRSVLSYKEEKIDGKNK